ncbi:DNA-processing protein DprA [Roseivirga sp. BDSF3-8]|uniref:DNA-processing protein DprA n=1 Tax=Roseivirga sp. BDSF3-8 TaxID=3241598 RepID=UPI00353200AE
MLQPANVHEVALTLVPGLGPRLIRQLLSYAGSAENVFALPVAKLIKVPGIGRQTAENILKYKNTSLAEEVLEKAEKNETSVLPFTHPSYPLQLRQIPDFPPLLYTRGDGALDFSRSVAIVGTRHATAYGKSVAEELVEALVPYSPVIVSGLAYGIDIAAHKASLKYGLPTYGVLASGTDIIYPAVHKQIARDMLTSGGLLSENPPGTKPDAHRFPARNRIIAGLAQVIVVVEAAKRGGALITARLGQDYNREVLAVPGNIGQVYSEGCHKLIRENVAGICTCAEDIVNQLGWLHSGSETTQAVTLDLSNFNEKEQKVITLLSENKFEMDLDDLCVRTKMRVSEMASVLLSLELQGLVSPLPGRRYRLKLAITGTAQTSLFV